MGFETTRHNQRGFSLSQQWSPEGLLLHQQTGDKRVERHYRYDALNQLTGITDSEWGEMRLTLTPQGQISEVQRRDKRGRAFRQLFGYDSELNLNHTDTLQLGIGVTEMAKSLQRSQLDYDEAGRVLRRGPIQCRYDACGRLIEKRVEKIGYRPQLTTYRWNTFDQLTHISLPNGERWHYQYDLFGRRIRKTCQQRKQTLPYPAANDEHFLWDGNNLISRQRVFHDGNTVRTQWVYEPDSFRPLAQLTSASHSQQHLYYTVTDHSGTPRALYDEDGDIQWQGEQRLWDRYQDSGARYHPRTYQEDPLYEPIRCDLRNQGQIEDKESGLYYNYHRYYDVELGQYISPDPIGLAGGIRPQAYVHNPMAWVDPLGLKCDDKNKKTTYWSKSRRDAFRQAKRDAGIPMRQQPKSITKPDLLDGNGNVMMGRNGQPIKTRQYEYVNNKGERVFIQEHSLGHTKATPGHGAEPHFNIRPQDPIRGVALDTKAPVGVHGHYNFP